MINCEFAIYKMLGVDDKVLKLYKECHEKYRFKGK